ncbi:MAG: PorV/PorQ family protein [Elusimicrobiota bacterium]
MRTLLLAALLFLGRPDCRAAEGAAFLNIGAGARALGLGGAYTALADDANALHWNAAGLAALEKREFTAGHAELFESTRLDSLTYAQPTSRGTFSGGVTYLSQARIEGRDALGRPAPGYNASDAALSLGYGRALEFARVGVGVKYIRSHIGSSEAQGVALDLGAQRRFERLSLGAALRNLGAGLKFADRRDDLPLRLALGAAYTSEGGHSAAVELINGPRGAGTQAALGGEYQAVSHLYLRAGYATQTAAGGSGFDAARGLAMGLGFRGATWSLDYAVLASGELGRAHRFSLGGRW